MSGLRKLLEKSGYSQKAIEYYEKMLNVGIVKDADAHFTYTGPCGDTMEMFLRIESNIITDAKFRAIGCAGSYVFASALTEMVKGNKVEDAEKLDEHDLLKHLGKIPAPKIHCACLAKRTLQKAIKQYKKTKK